MRLACWLFPAGTFRSRFILRSRQADIEIRCVDIKKEENDLFFVRGCRSTILERFTELHSSSQLEIKTCVKVTILKQMKRRRFERRLGQSVDSSVATKTTTSTSFVRHFNHLVVAYFVML